MEKIGRVEGLEILGMDCLSSEPLEDVLWIFDQHPHVPVFLKRQIIRDPEHNSIPEKVFPLANKVSIVVSSQN